MAGFEISKWKIQISNLKSQIAEFPRLKSRGPIELAHRVRLTIAIREAYTQESQIPARH